jgi:hypothetical protein
MIYSDDAADEPSDGKEDTVTIANIANKSVAETVLDHLYKGNRGLQVIFIFFEIAKLLLITSQDIRYTKKGENTTYKDMTATKQIQTAPKAAETNKQPAEGKNYKSTGPAETEPTPEQNSRKKIIHR